MRESAGDRGRVGFGLTALRPERRRPFDRRHSPTLRMLFAAGFALVGLLALSAGPPAGVGTSPHLPRAVPVGESLISTPVKHRASSPSAKTTRARGVTLATSWPKTLTLVTDSVTLGAEAALDSALPDWHIEVLGKPALMVKQAVPQYLPPGKRVGTVVVVGLGYNSLWQKDRVNFDAWAAQFDREADSLVADLRDRGAKKIVWVTLREPSPQVVTDSSRWQYDHYAWFFPYVNERLRALVQRQPDVALADWAAVSDHVGLTYDLIHLAPAGARLIAQTIAAVVRTQVRAGG